LRESHESDVVVNALERTDETISNGLEFIERLELVDEKDRDIIFPPNSLAAT